MKKIFTVGLFLSLVISMTSFAQVLLEENFTSAPGTALTAAGWNQTGTSSATPILTSASGLTLGGYFGSGIGNGAAVGTSGQDVNKFLNDTTTSSGTLYASFLVNVTSAQAAGDYFFHFSQNAVNTFDFLGRVYVKLASNGKLSFGIGKSSTNAAVPPVYSDSVYETSTTYLLVVKYAINPDTLDNVASLYINLGVPSTEPSAALISTTTSGTVREPAYIGAIGLRQGNASNAAVVTVDGIRVGKTWNDVVKFYTTIATAIEDLNNDFVPDNLDDTVTVRGIITSPNYQTSNSSYYLYDGTAATDVFMYAPPKFNWALGDSLTITGKVAQYNGMTEIILLDSTTWTFHSAGHTPPEPIVITIAQFNANPELYEGSLVGFRSLTKKSGTWPSSGSANIILTDGVDTLVYRIDSDTDIDGSTEPTWPRDVIGIISQFDASSPYNGGYQFFPRYTTDILPAGTIPVELVSLTAAEVASGVKIQWATATETNNKGFEVQRKSSNGKYEALGFVAGAGTTTERKSYSFVDRDVRNGKYTYRLKQVDYDGTVKFLKELDVDVKGSTPEKFGLDQNYPNPFNPSTTIRFTLAVDSKVSLKLFNVLGQEVAALLNGSYQAGPHEFKFNASHLNSGIYFYKIQANGLDGSAFSTVRKMMLAK